MNRLIQRPRLLIAALAIAASIGGVWLFRERFLMAAAQWLDIGERPRPCDYVLVLPGGEETRPFVAAAIVKRGLGKRALVPRTAASPDAAEGIEKTAHEIACEVLRRRGVPPGDVRLIGQSSVSTYTDALALAEFLNDQPPVVVAIVTNELHTRRARWVFRRVLGRRSDDLYFVGAPDDHFDKKSWWHCKQGAWACLSEYGKLAAYVVLYGDRAVWAGLAIGAIVIVLLVRGLRRGRKKGAAALVCTGG